MTRLAALLERETGWRGVLAAIGAAAALLIYLIGETADTRVPIALWRENLILWVTLAGAALLLTLRPQRWSWSILYALALASIVTGLHHLVRGRLSVPDWPTDGPIGLPLSTALLIAYVSLPFFQTARDAGRWNPDYPSLHDYAWNAPLQWAGAGLFTLLFWAILWLWGQLFSLIDITLFKRLFDNGWLMSALLGGAFGLAMAVLRSREAVIGNVRALLIKLLTVLCPVLALALVLFLLTLPFTGLTPLWATGKATPIVLAAAILAVWLLNAAVDDTEVHASTAPPVVLAAKALALALLPLGIIAAVSLGLRIDQYGLTPDRGYGVLAVVLALFYAASYAVIVLWRRAAWRMHLRRANIVLALVSMGVFLLSLTPVADPVSWAARTQASALLAGKIKADAFDFGALWYEMGRPGQAALARIEAASDHPEAAEIASQIALAKAAGDYWTWRSSFAERANQQPEGALEALRARLRGVGDVRLPPDDALAVYLAGQSTVDEDSARKEASEPIHVLVHPDMANAWLFVDVARQTVIVLRAAEPSESAKPGAVWTTRWLGPRGRNFDGLRAAIEAGQAGPVTVILPAIRLGDTVFNLREDLPLDPPPEPLQGNTP